MDWISLITTITTIICGGGWFIYYRANKMKAYGEATQAEAEGWKAQQDVYQQTISDLKESCEYIRKDRDLLRKENQELRDENRLLRDKINSLELQMSDLRRDISRQGRRIESLVNNKKKKNGTNENKQ